MDEDTRHLVEGWLSARRSGDERLAVAMGEHLVAGGACPIEIRLCLPGCWRRAHADRGLGSYVESLGPTAPVTGLEKALLVMAAGRLHPAALCSAERVRPGLLLFAAASGAAARGRGELAVRWLRICAPPSERRDLFEAIVALEIASVGDMPPPAESSPWSSTSSPSASIAQRCGALLCSRAAALERRGRLLEALGLVELGQWLAPAAGGDEAASVALAVQGAELWLALGNAPEAERVLEPALARALSMFGEVHELPRRVRLALARVWLHRDDVGRAAEELTLLRAQTEAAVGAADPELADVLCSEGAARAALGRWDEAESLTRRALAIYEGSGRDDGRGAAMGLHWLGLAHAARGDALVAAQTLRAAVSLRSSCLGPEHPDLGESLVALGQSLQGAGAMAEAEQALGRALDAFARSVGVRDERFRVSTECLASMLVADGRPAEAEARLAELVAWSPERWWGSDALQSPPTHGASRSRRDESAGPRSQIGRFSRGLASKDEVMRTLVEHADWYVPQTLVSREGAGRPIDLGATGGRGAPALFTDERAAAEAAAHGEARGAYVGGVPGAELFAGIERKLRRARINPGSPSDEGWSLESGALAELSHWAEIVAFERLLRAAAAPDDPALLSRIRDFGAYIVPVERDTGAMLTVAGGAGLRDVAAVFTAPDRASGLLGGAPEHVRQRMRFLTLDGRAVLRMLPAQPVDGIVIDCAGPAPWVAPLWLCERALRGR